MPRAGSVRQRRTSRNPAKNFCSWFIAAGLGGLFYYAIAPKDGVYADRDGESIAVALTH